jgi:hypothetical protein
MRDGERLVKNKIRPGAEDVANFSLIAKESYGDGGISGCGFVCILQHECGAVGVIEVDDDGVILLLHKTAERFGIVAALGGHSESGEYRIQRGGGLFVFRD